MAVFVLVVLALIASAAVLLFARTEAPGGDGEPPVRAFERGLRFWVHPDAEQRAEARAAAAEPVDVTLDQMLRATLESGPGYLQPEEITDSLHEVAARVRPGRAKDDEPDGRQDRPGARTTPVRTASSRAHGVPAGSRVAPARPDRLSR